MIDYHRLVQRDMAAILATYAETGVTGLADRFFDAFISTVEKADENPERFHSSGQGFRRGNIPGFPYHFLYKRTGTGIKVTVLRHHSRNPSLGTRRR